MPKLTSPSDLKAKVKQWVSTKKNGGFLPFLLAENSKELIRNFATPADLPDLSKRLKLLSKMQTSKAHIYLKDSSHIGTLSAEKMSNLVKEAVSRIQEVQLSGKEVVLHGDFSAIPTFQYQYFLKSVKTRLEYSAEEILVSTIPSNARIRELRLEAKRISDLGPVAVNLMVHESLPQEIDAPPTLEQTLLMERLVKRLMAEAQERCMPGVKSEKMLSIISHHKRYFSRSKNLIFVNNTIEAEKLSREITKAFEGSGMCAVPYSSSIAPNKNKLALSQFKDRNNKVRFLVFTSKAGEGKNLPDADRLYVLTPPNGAQEFLQLIGRVGRGRVGWVHFILSNAERAQYLRTMKELKELAGLMPYLEATALGQSKTNDSKEKLVKFL